MFEGANKNAEFGARVVARKLLQHYTSANSTNDIVSYPANASAHHDANAGIKHNALYAVLPTSFLPSFHAGASAGTSARTCAYSSWTLGAWTRTVSSTWAVRAVMVSFSANVHAVWGHGPCACTCTCTSPDAVYSSA